MYALSAATISLNSIDDLHQLIPRALVKACLADFYEGAWMTLVHRLELAMNAHFQFQEDPGDLEKHQQVEHITMLASTALAISERLDTQLFAHLADQVSRLSHLPIEDYYPECRRMVATQSADELWSWLEQRLSNPPMSECGTTWSVQWKALGRSWCVECENRTEVRAVADELAAALQIATVELSDVDWRLFDYEVRVRVELSAGEVRVVEEGGLSGEEIRVTIPPSIPLGIDRSERHLQIVGALLHIVTSGEMASGVQIDEAMERLAGGVLRQFLIGQSYDEIAGRWGHQLWGDRWARFEIEPVFSGRSFKSEAHPEVERDASPVFSMIQTNLWDEANWVGVVSIPAQPGGPSYPALGLIFSQLDAARAIFERWRTQLGDEDSDTQIRVSVILDCHQGEQPHRYFVSIGTNIERLPKQNGEVMLVSRNYACSVSNWPALSLCLEEAKCGSYLLLPAHADNDVRTCLWDMSIKKTKLVVKYIDEIGENDQDRAVLLRPD